MDKTLTSFLIALQPLVLLSFLIALQPLVLLSFLIQVEGNIGVNYGTVADNLPPPSKVARFLLDSTIINRVKLYDTNQEILKAFAHTGIAITVAVPNNLITNLANFRFSQQWVKTNIAPHVPATNIVRIVVGNEVLSTTDNSVVSYLVPAMQTLHAALIAEDLDRRIKVSTPHSLGILASSSPPSSGRFKQENVALIKQLLGFLRATGSSFMINPYPFFGYSSDTLDYAMFRPNSGVFDEMTERKYTNMLDAQLDATFSALKQLGFGDIEIVIAETGWPSKGDPGQTGVDTESAREYNGKLVKHVMSGLGTPLMPNKTFETYIFALFNENLKPGPTTERNFGLFKPDMTPVYDVGIFRHTVGSDSPSHWDPERGPPVQRSNGGKTWCIPKTRASEEVLQMNIDYVCGLGFDCQPIREGGRCFYPNSVRAHAAYAMNVYYQATGRHYYDCDFSGTGAITPSNPSYGRCTY